MKKILFITALGLANLQAAYAQDYFGPTNITKANLEKTAIYGPANLTQVKTDSLTVAGPLQFNNLEVTQNTIVNGPVNDSENGKFVQFSITGPFQAKQIAADQFTAVGLVKVKRMDVIGDTNIIGSLEAENSRFKDITITANNITLDTVDVANILVKNDSNPKQTLYLKGKTVVSGNINFESGRGLVIKGKDAEVKGEIKGAIEQKG